MYCWPSWDRGAPYHTVDYGLFIKSTEPDAIIFKALCGTSLVTLPPIIWGGRDLRSPPSGPQTQIPKPKPYPLAPVPSPKGCVGAPRTEAISQLLITQQRSQDLEEAKCEFLTGPKSARELELLAQFLKKRLRFPTTQRVLRDEADCGSFSSSSSLLSSLELSDATIYEPQIRARLGTASHF